jgi:hypothetical protein
MATVMPFGHLPGNWRVVSLYDCHGKTILIVDGRAKDGHW